MRSSAISARKDEKESLLATRSHLISREAENNKSAAKLSLFSQAVKQLQVAANLTKYGIEVGIETLKTMLTSSLSYAYFKGGAIFAQVPHHNGGLLGHLKFDANLTDRLTAAALKTKNGVVTYWAGPFLPALYIIKNETRESVVKEAHIGSISVESEKYISWLTRGNNVMTNFLAFMSVNSHRYQKQRHFLLDYFHGGAHKRLPTLDDATKDFLSDYFNNEKERSIPLREFITRLVLHASSLMLSLTQCSLDKLYSENSEYHSLIDYVAQYGISEQGDAEYESKLFHFFCELFKRNFDIISTDKLDTNSKAIFDFLSLFIIKFSVTIHLLDKIFISIRLLVLSSINTHSL